MAHPLPLHAQAQTQSSRVPFLRALLIGATVLGLLTSAQHWVAMQLDDVDVGWKTLGHALSNQMPVWYAWLLLAPIVRLAVQRLPFARRRLHVAIPAHVLLAVGSVLVHELVVLVAHRVLSFPTPTGPLLTVYAERIPFRFTIGLLGYAVLFGAVIAIDYYGRLREREVATEALRRQLAEARIEMLRMQLNPHFLFNTMNTIAMLVRRGDRTEAVEMLARLSDLLRQSLEDSPPQESSLRGELAFIERYLDIERVRFADRLRIEVDVDPALLEFAVPTLVLQPLVENAIRHGIARKAASGLIQITGRPADDGIVLQVADDGPGFAPDQDPTGIGIRNTRSRIAQLYGPAATLTYAARPGGGTVATLVLPRRVRMPEREVAAVGAT